MKNKSLFFLIAISILLACIFISGCTSESSGTDTNTDTAQQTGSGDMGDIPAGDGNMTRPDGGNMTPPDGNMTMPAGDGNMTPPDGGMGGGEMPEGEMPDGTPPEESS